MLWWGYLHVNGTIHVKKYFNEFSYGDISEAQKSPFVDMAIGPFPAESREEAVAYCNRQFGTD